jgi:two-component system LytT family response regulator
MKAIIIDDEPHSIGILKQLLSLYCPRVKLIAECSNAETGAAAIQELQPELVFLDIAMPRKSGIEMLEEMEEINFEIIFVTAYNEYAIKAFHYSATDYLIKPIEEQQLVLAVQKAEKRIAGRQHQEQVHALTHNLKHPADMQRMKLCIPTIKGFQVVEINDILYCEADKNYTVFHMADKKNVCSSRTMLEYELLLSDSFFMRVHRSYLINLNHIREYQRGDGGIVVMKDGMEIEISRRKKEPFLEKVKAFFRI